MDESLNVMERSVIGSILEPSTRTLEDIDLDPADFRDPKCEAVYRVATEMHMQGKHVDTTTVDAAIRADPEFVIQGVDFAWLFECVSNNTRFNYVDDYVAHIKAAAVRRRVKQSAMRVAVAADEDMDAEDLVDLARREMDHAGHVDGDPLETLHSSMLTTLDNLGKPVDAVLTPWADLNSLMGGFAPGRLYVIGARPAVGKALSLDTKLPTPSGWTTMGEVQVGQELIGMDGKPTTVVAATEVMTGRPCYRVTFDDGTQIIADAQHQWLTSTRASRRALTPPKGYVFNRNSPFSRDQRSKSTGQSIKTTQEIADTLRTTTAERRLNHAVPLTAPIEGRHQQLLIDPYVLGVWLGDGSSRHPQITTADQEVVENIIAAGYPCRKIAAKYQYTLSEGRGKGARFLNELRTLGVLRNKHIPAEYLRASYEQRLALMQGLMDTDGTVSAVSGRCSFDVTSRQLAEGFRELAHTLGIRTSWAEKKVNGRTDQSSICYRVGFTTSRPVARLPRKASKIPSSSTLRTAQRMITNVEKIESVPVRCVQVSSSDHMYLASESMIPTHNSVVALQSALGLAQHGYVSFVSLEMSKDEINKRIIAHDLEIPMDRLMGGSLSESQWGKVRDHMDVWARSKLMVNDDPNVTFSALRKHARTVAKRGHLAGIVVDYLQLMSAPRGDQRKRHEVVSEFSRSLKLLARDLNVPVIALSQLNRESANRQDNAPRITDLRESGSVEQDADVVILLHRELLGPRNRELSMIVAKNRQGRTNIIDLDFYGEFSKAVTRGGRSPQGMSF